MINKYISDYCNGFDFVFKEHISSIIDGINIEADVFEHNDRFNFRTKAHFVLTKGKYSYEYDAVDKTVSASVTAIFEAENGYIYFVKAKGHNGDIVLLVSIDKEGALIDTYTIYQKESSPYTDNVWTNNYQDQYHGITSVPEEGYLQSYATVTSNAYKLAVKCAFEANKLVDGGNN